MTEAWIQGWGFFPSLAAVTNVLLHFNSNDECCSAGRHGRRDEVGIFSKKNPLIVTAF